ncbi:uncharacterized protein EAE97_005888 [Botrytis byssoidea]|uniref:Uncharacterized protein n=1 Tax=Botrytis byssoidea TaxID=139641 RepID=A0A9P5IMF1_9HELO|nr:uncharacterized protein EAE97_005888 [Botrytis byssoidea]KAF7943818.1 hypothetical protein EAE97_005888 [Botrytis byssoidea]
MFYLFKDRTYTFRLLFISVSFLALRYAQRFTPTTRIGNTITSIVLRIFKFFIIYQSINTIADLAFEVAKANTATFSNMTTEFVNFFSNVDEVKISMFLAIMIIIPYVRSGCPNELPTEFSLVLLFIGFIYVGSNFEGPQNYMLTFVLLIFLALLVYKTVISTELQNRHSNKVVMEPKPN